MQPTAKLALADGTVFAGAGCGAEGEVYGEGVLNPSMTGYPELRR
ncbi:MAG: carbamoyl phosphate synthase small subunit, partial [Planctomycetes bacterium]|nr:carbamoyl phosphate synthase small subunit [Planctomycetota bacterium]